MALSQMSSESNSEHSSQQEIKQVATLAVKPITTEKDGFVTAASDSLADNYGVTAPTHSGWKGSFSANNMPYLKEGSVAKSARMVREFSFTGASGRLPPAVGGCRSAL